MFTKGRLIFAGIFVIAFAIGLILMYRKDKKERATNYKGATKIIISILAFLVVFMIIVKGLKWI